MITPNDIDQIFDKWIQEKIHNSPVSQHEGAYNHLIESLKSLRSQVKAVVPASGLPLQKNVVKE